MCITTNLMKKESVEMIDKIIIKTAKSAKLVKNTWRYAQQKQNDYPHARNGTI